MNRPDLLFRPRGGPWPVAALCGLAIVGLAARAGMLDFLSGDAIRFLLPWHAHLRQFGFAAFAAPFTDYSPPYPFALYLLTLIGGPPLVMIKVLSITFDLVAALVMFALVRGVRPTGWSAAYAAAAVWCLPTVLINSARWAQCDMIYGVFLLACVGAVLKRRPRTAMIAFGVALGIKAQAMFLAPFLLVMLACNALRWRDIIWPPILYIALASPALIAGRPLAEVLTIYWRQASVYPQPSFNAANLYIYLPHDLGWFKPAALGLTIVATLAMGWAGWRAHSLGKDKLASDPRFVLLTAVLSCVLAPFLLPGMHERYFLPAGLMSLALAFCWPRSWPVAALLEVSSFLSYLQYDDDSRPGLWPSWLLAGSLSFAALLNMAVLALLVWRWLALLVPERVAFGLDRRQILARGALVAALYWAGFAARPAPAASPPASPATAALRS